MRKPAPPFRPRSKGPAPRPELRPALSETEFHLMAADLLRRGVPPGAGFWFHVPNQGKRSVVTGGLFKGMGMMPGMTDIVLVSGSPPPGGGRVAFLELKAGRGKLRPEQEAFRETCRVMGIEWGEARTLEEVEAFARRFYGGAGLKFRARVG